MRNQFSIHLLWDSLSFSLQAGRTPLVGWSVGNVVMHTKVQTDIPWIDLAETIESFRAHSFPVKMHEGPFCVDEIVRVHIFGNIIGRSRRVHKWN